MNNVSFLFTGSGNCSRRTFFIKMNCNGNKKEQFFLIAVINNFIRKDIYSRNITAERNESVNGGKRGDYIPFLTKKTPLLF